MEISILSSAKFKGADVYITGDLYYHVAHDAMMMGLNVIDPGHNVEKIMKKGVANYLTKVSVEKGYDVSIFPSEQKTDPFQFVYKKVKALYRCSYLVKKND